MASPFRFFWKYQRPMMVVVTGIAIICFTLDDSLRMSGDSQTSNKFFAAFVMGLIGACIAWVAGMRAGEEGKNYWWQGAIIGGALGVVLMIATAPKEVGISTSLGTLSPKKIRELRVQRDLANGCVRFAYGKREKLDDREFQRFLFGSTSTRDVVTNFLLRGEADKLGIQVSNDDINNFINEVSEKNVKARDFQKHCLDHGADQSQIFDALRGELRAKIAFQAISPSFDAYSPQQYWQDFAKFHIRHSIETAAVPTDAFVKLVEAPAKGDLEAFFEKYKATFPGGEFAGFRIPERKRVAYFTNSFESAEKEVGTVSEDDLKKLYDDRKELFYKVELLPTDSKPKDADSKPATESKPADAATKAEEPKSETPKAEAPKADAPKTEAPKPDPAASDKKAESEKPKPAEPVKPGETPSKKDEKPEAEKPAGSDCDEQNDAAPPAKPEDKAADKKVAAEAKDSAAAKDPAAVKDPVVADGKDPLPEANPETAATTKEAPKYKTYEEVKDELRDVLLRDRAQALIQKKLEAAAKAISSERFTISEELAVKADMAAQKPGDQRIDNSNEVAKTLSAFAKTYAAKHGLSYTETDLLTYQELVDSKEHMLGTAYEPLDPTNMRSAPQSAPVRIFGSGSALFIPETVETIDGKSRFVFWSIEAIEETVPKFDDPGIRDRVEASWRTEKARVLAQKRAEELIKLAAEGIAAKKSLAESLGEGVTATGEKDSIELSVISPQSFTWLTQSTQGLQANFMARRQFEFGTIPGVPQVHDVFMQSVAGMAVGDIKEIANADKSAYHVVYLKSRFPSEPGDISYKAIRQQYLNDSQFGFVLSPVSEIAGQKLNEVYARWLGKFMEKYAVNVNEIGQDE